MKVLRLRLQRKRYPGGASPHRGHPPRQRFRVRRLRRLLRRHPYPLQPILRPLVAPIRPNHPRRVRLHTPLRLPSPTHHKSSLPILGIRPMHSLPTRLMPGNRPISLERIQGARRLTRITISSQPIHRDTTRRRIPQRRPIPMVHNLPGDIRKHERFRLWPGSA